MYRITVVLIWPLCPLVKTFSQSWRKDKIPDCPDKSSSCLTDRRWARFLEGRIPPDHRDWTQEQIDCLTIAWSLFLSYEQMKAWAPKAKKQQQQQQKQIHLVPVCAHEQSFTDCWLCLTVMRLQTLIDWAPHQNATAVFEQYIVKSTGNCQWGRKSLFFLTLNSLNSSLWQVNPAKIHFLQQKDNKWAHNFASLANNKAFWYWLLHFIKRNIVIIKILLFILFYYNIIIL